MNIFSLLLVNIADFIIFITYLSCCKMPLKIHNLYYVIIYIPFITYINLFNLPYINFLCSIISMLFIVVFLFSLNLKKSILISILFTIIGSISELITIFFLNKLFPSTLETILNSSFYIMFNEIVKALLLFSIIPLKKLIQNKIFFKAIAPIIILPLSIILLIFGIVKNFIYTNIYIQLSVFLLFLSNFVILYILNKVNDSQLLQSEINDLKAKDKINALSYKLIEQKYDANRKYIHDFRKHINALSVLFSKKDYNEVERYLKKISNVTYNLSNDRLSGNKLLDITLNSVISRDRLENINIIFEIVEDIKIKSEYMYNFITILSNILENALESCEKIPNSYIRISFLQNKTNYITIKVINSAYKKNSDILITEKNDTNPHGIGTKIIKDVVQLLQGKVFFKYSTQFNEFETLVIIPAKNIIQTQNHCDI